MHLCLDVDDTITYAPKFFATVCERFADAQITIVTFRSDKTSTESYLKSEGVRFDNVIVSTDPIHGRTEQETLHEWNASFVNQLRPDIFFEDMPEVVALIDSSILVFMPCDEVIREWIKTQIGCPPTQP